MKKSWEFQTFYEGMLLIRCLPWLIGYFVGLYIYYFTDNLYTILFGFFIAIPLYYVIDEPSRNWMHKISGWTIEKGDYIRNVCKGCSIYKICYECAENDFLYNPENEESRSKIRELLHKYLFTYESLEKATNDFEKNFALEELEKISRELKESIPILENHDKEES